MSGSRRWRVSNAAFGLSAGGALSLLLLACQPTLKVEAPDKPIVINLNVKIEQEVRVKIERELDDAFANNPELFQ